MTALFTGDDGKPRCHWCRATPEYITYHDTEWGFPVNDDQRLFEKLSLEGFQSGLSWRTILMKRENFRKAFRNFDINKVARFNTNDVERLLQDAGIVRHRGKIEAVINNARQAKKLIKSEGSLANYFWSYAPEDAGGPQTISLSAESTALSKALKKMGWKFVGPTTVYSFMQAMGMVNDHYEGCVIRAEVGAMRQEFQRGSRLAGR